MVTNQIINKSLKAVNKAVKSLTDEELTVIGFYHDSFSKPTIEIEHHPKCNKYIVAGQAVYYLHKGIYRFGQFELEGCRIVWRELDTNRLH